MTSTPTLLYPAVDIVNYASSNLSQSTNAIVENTAQCEVKASFKVSIELPPNRTIKDGGIFSIGELGIRYWVNFSPARTERNNILSFTKYRGAQIMPYSASSESEKESDLNYLWNFPEETIEEILDNVKAEILKQQL